MKITFISFLTLPLLMLIHLVNIYIFNNYDPKLGENYTFLIFLILHTLSSIMIALIYTYSYYLINKSFENSKSKRVSILTFLSSLLLNGSAIISFFLTNYFELFTSIIIWALIIFVIAIITYKIENHFAKSNFLV